MMASSSRKNYDLITSAGGLVIRLSPLPTDKEASLVLDLFWQVTICGFAKSLGF